MGPRSFARKVIDRLSWETTKAVRKTPLPRLNRTFGLLRRPEGYLRQTGWVQSERRGLPVAADGSPLPWYTFPFIAFLEPRLPHDTTVFEFGMGNSTLWWSRRAASVTAVEHDPDWFATISAKMPENVSAKVRDVRSDGYINAAADQGPFSIIVIDGRRRVKSMRGSLPSLAANGVVIWDNSERDWYREGYDLLAGNGFKRLDFWGLGPLSHHPWCTSVFYRPGNCLGI